MKQYGLRILLAAIVAVAAMPAIAGTQTGGSGIQNGPAIGIGTRVLEKPDLVTRPGTIYGKGNAFSRPSGPCGRNQFVVIDAREHVYVTNKGELVFRIHLGVENRGLTPAKNFVNRLRTTNLGANNTASVQTVARLNPGETTTQIFEMPFFLKNLKNRNIVDLEYTVNYNNQVRERSRGNNTCRMKLEFVKNKYDLVIKSFRFNRMAPTCVSGQPVYYFDVTVKNKGSGWLWMYVDYQEIPRMPVMVQDLHTPTNPQGWSGRVPLLPATDLNSAFKPGESKRYQIEVPYYRNDPDHMRRGPTHLFQASIRNTTAKSVTLSIPSPTACRGGQPARSKSQKSAPRTVKPIPGKLLPR